MTTFITPNAIDLAVNLQVGHLEVVASDRGDTMVTVVPTNPAKTVDHRGVDDTTVDFDGQRLTVTGPKPRFSWIGPGQYDSVDVTVELPAGSRLTAEIAVGGLRTTGRLGATRAKCSTGSATLDETGDLWLRAGHGSATVGTADGSAEITADHGQLRIGTITGDAILKASHGNIVVGQSGGDLEAKLSYGDLEIATALASVTAKTAYGTIHIDEVSAGSIELESGYGELSIGVRAAVAAWLDLSSKEGQVRNRLDVQAAPEPSEQTVAVRARTGYGDITVQHSATKGADR